jgi:hypothetical protein
MNNNVLYVGLAVHKNSIDVALAEAGSEVRHYGSIGGDDIPIVRIWRNLIGLQPQKHAKQSDD